jgi:hypothetical protein
MPKKIIEAPLISIAKLKNIPELGSAQYGKIRNQLSFSGKFRVARIAPTKKTAPARNMR